jgi:hypothetical protein
MLHVWHSNGRMLPSEDLLRSLVERLGAVEVRRLLMTSMPGPNKPSPSSAIDEALEDWIKQVTATRFSYAWSIHRDNDVVVEITVLNVKNRYEAENALHGLQPLAHGIQPCEVLL